MKPTIKTFFTSKGRLGPRDYCKLMGISIGITLMILLIIYGWVIYPISALTLDQLIDILLATLSPTKFIQVVVKIMTFMLLFGAIAGIYILLFALTFNLHIRRLHDLNKSGFFYLLILGLVLGASFLIIQMGHIKARHIPFVPISLTTVMWIILSTLPGTPGPNTYDTPPNQNSQTTKQ